LECASAWFESTLKLEQWQIWKCSCDGMLNIHFAAAMKTTLAHQVSSGGWFCCYHWILHTHTHVRMRTHYIILSLLHQKEPVRCKT